MKNFLKSFFASVFGVFFAVLFVLVAIPLILSVLIGPIGWSPATVIESQAVLHVLLDGDVVDGGPTMDWIFGEGRHRIRLQKMIKAIRLAREDKRVVGAVLDIRSPAIGWSSATAIRRELEAFKEAKKFVFTYADRLDEMGLYLASGSDKTFMQPYGDIELNGLAMETPFVRGLLAKLEVKPMVFRVGRFKAAVEPLILEKMSPENRQQTAELIGDLWAEARNSISARSGVAPAQLESWTQQLSVASVAEAKKAGLITDALFSDEFDARIREAAGWGEDDETNYISMHEMNAQERRKKTEKRKIALVVAEGEIVKGEGGRGEVGDDTLLEALSEIEEDPEIAAVVLRVNSPGGDALASDIIWRELAVIDEEKPVIASMGDIAASGGYYIAAGARHIVAEPTTITGSIGVFGVLFNAESLFKNKLGVQFDRVGTHEHSDFGNYTRPLALREQQVIQSGVERTYRRFVEVVAQSRGFEKTQDVEALAEGRVWSGKRAMSLGLVDELGGLDRAMAKAAELAGLGDGYEVISYPRPTDRLSRLFEHVLDDAHVGMQLLPPRVQAWTAGLLPLSWATDLNGSVATSLERAVKLAVRAKRPVLWAQEWLDAKGIR